VKHTGSTGSRQDWTFHVKQPVGDASMTRR
jgi:hypothetical protein